MRTYKTARQADMPRHMCVAILGGPCDVPGLPRHEVEITSRDNFAVLVAERVRILLGRSVEDPIILDVDTVTGAVETIDAEEADRRFAPACFKADPPFGGSSKANSQPN